MLFLWVIACILILILHNFQLLVFFRGQGFAMLAVLGMALLLALMKTIFGADPHGFVGWLISTRHFFIAGALMAVKAFGTLTVDVALAVAMLCQLCLLLLLFRQFQNRLVTATDFLPARDFSSGLWRYADLMIMPCVLIGSEALIYLFARLLVEVVQAGVALLGARAISNLRSARELQDRSEFIGLAARLNLGTLLVGGGISLGVLTSGRYIADAIGASELSFQPVLLWLLAGAAGPMLFGATDPILRAAQIRFPLIFLPTLMMALAWVAVLSTPVPTALFMAQVMAVLNLSASAIAALILARKIGVWPGLSALMFRQIKLI
ncbi:MAG: hypothetical protein ABJL67_19080 [Sulfitobacter sp.]